MAATTEETFPKVGQMGLPIFVGLRGMDIGSATHLWRYRRAWRDAGHAGHGRRLPAHSDLRRATEEAAREEPCESITFYFSRQADLQRRGVGRSGAAPAERLQARVDTLAGLSYEEILRSAWPSAPPPR